MCGRYVLKEDAPALAAYLGMEAEDAVLAGFCATPRFNVAPTQAILAVRHGGEGGREREGVILRWGLVPFWAKDVKIGARMINARSETAFEKPAFRAAMRRRRCVLPASGFYEWEKRGDHKQPWYIRRRDEKPLWFAGIWEHWGEGEDQFESGSILTTGANDCLAPIHDRMPVILDLEGVEIWLNPETGEAELRELLQPCLADWLMRYEVSTRVNRPVIDEPGLLEPVPGAD